MNNAKVRIYDLSKELHLENRDLLDICEKLNISVKSHSSTISESDAERIKTAAEKYASYPPGARRPEPKPVERKQQILAIHHKKERSREAISPNPTPTTTSVLTAPPATPQSSNLSHPTSERSPVTEKNPPKANASEPRPRQEGAPRPVSPVVPTNGASSGTTENRQSRPSPASQLIKPAINRDRDRTQAPSQAASQAPSQAPSKPSSPPSEERSRESKVSKPVIITLKDSLVKKAEKAPDKAPSKTGGLQRPGEKVKAKLELNRPKPPQEEDDNLPELLEFPLDGESAKSTDDDLLDDPATELLKQKPQLKRLTAPRPAKRSKWEEEEEEQRENKAKAAAKNKRRPSLLDDDDDDDAAALSASAAQAALVSLSIARPAKPASMMAATKAKAPSVGHRPRKAPVKADGSNIGRTKTDRRDRKEVIERPESILLSSSLTIRELAELLVVSEMEIIKHLFQKGTAVQITQTLDEATARSVAEDFGVAILTEEVVAAATKVTEMLDATDLEHLERRPPVVTIMGHVDHGKTTLLDSIRKTKVAQGEAGGITQHIGAYHVDIEHNGKSEQIVFLDTPGHEAFTAMRARGARVTDLAILVVAADDGVQPQTREAISHAKAAEVPIIVAINKVDKEGANPDRIKQELSELGLVSEEWGGDTIMVPVSALRGQNLDTLLEMILLVSEVGELVANPDRAAKGTVIEANLDRTRGPVATLLVQNGTLRVGDVIVAGAVLGKIRAMIDDRGNKVDAATPSFAVEVLGLNGVPSAGDEFDVFANEKEARALSEQRTDSNRQTRLQQQMSSRRVTLSTLSAQAQEGELKELNLILKADVQGSVEAIVGSLSQLPQNEVQIRVLLAAPGEITETDVDLAAASGAVVVGFNTTLATGSRQAADQEGVDIREYDIIYKLLDDIQGAMEGLLDPEEIETPLGQAEVRAVFAVGRGAVAGCYVLSGKIVRNRNLRVRRGGNVVYEGMIDSLKRMKEDAREVNAGYECGIGISKFTDWKEGDIIEAYEMSMKRRSLSPSN